MGSLNGDVTVMRNGRSTSQVSVYNYPEHLNPFYEDEQHKRLRFWKINKKDNGGRRNSFSIGNLKDMWAFKTFRMKKKSSTLGINKTSESPPVLRRDYPLDNGWNTFDNRLRASNTSSINGDCFQRNGTYRSSLQTLPTSSERIGLNRNDGYRSTIQVTRANPRFQTLQQQQQQTLGISQNRRSSQSSMMSTNPFESDDDDENINTNGMKSVINGSTTTLTSRTPRKKRQAPAPPTPSHGRSNVVSTPPIIRLETSHDNTNDKLRIEEDIDIANLTAEIESFVKTKSNDEVEPTTTTTTITETTAIQSLDNKEKISKEEMENEKPKITPAGTETLHGVTITDTSNKEKATGQITTTTTTTITITDIDTAAASVEKEINVTQVVNEIETKIDENTEIEINGAIPKKINNQQTILNNNETPVVAKLCIKETCTEELPQKPIPLKRQSKTQTQAETETEAEVGQIECIHVHVESPKATPRQDHPHNDLTSFKTAESSQESSETIITNKTPFVLTSPPSKHKRNHTPRVEYKTQPVLRETAKIVATVDNNALNIKEERINGKPEISPKPATEELNGKIQSFAEIHKPMRRHTQNGHGHIKRASHEGSISPPPTVPPTQQETDKKINNTEKVKAQTNDTKVETAEAFNQATTAPINNLKIIETKNVVEEHKLKEIKDYNASELQKQEDNEYDLLYRPKPANHLEWKRSTLAPLETNIPPEKRKSVKDIIESINRSQRLLNAAANKDFTVLQNQPTNAAIRQQTSSFKVNNNNLNESLKMLDATQQEINRLIEETTPATEAVANAANSPSPSPSNCNNEYAEAQELDNNEIFQKCKVKKEVYDYRESSPITSNLDWNPVPKPKRTKPGYD